jgi:hypothetical protein
MSKRKRRNRLRHACPRCVDPSPERGLPLTIPFGIPTYWPPEAALAIFEFIDEMRDIVLAVYGSHIDDAARKQWHSPPANPAVIPDDELPF